VFVFPDAVETEPAVVLHETGRLGTGRPLASVKIATTVDVALPRLEVHTLGGNAPTTTWAAVDAAATDALV